MSILGQDVSDPGAKRNKEVRECFKFSFNLSCSENWVGKQGCGGGLSQLLSIGQTGGGCELRPLGQEEEIESAAMVFWQRRVGVSGVSTGPQGAPSPLTTRAGQRSRTRAVANEKDVQWEDGAGKTLSPQFPELSCQLSEPQSGPHHPQAPSPQV